MYVKLTIPERLQDLRKERHLTLEQLAEQTGLSKSALGKYETDDYKDISPFAIATLANCYGVSTDYLLGLSENKNHPNAELQALHLSDDMVTLLSSATINNRLLCELATHPNFRRLMVDMEIFIDRIADMRVDQMNLILEATRQTILKEHAPGENDLYMRTRELGQVQENDFYSILKVMHDLPVCIRLLDPPLHEFLPSLEKLLVETTELRIRKDNPQLLEEKERLLAQVVKLHEANPMMGHRGCRLGITYPEVYEMQMHAIFNAASRLTRDGYTVLPEIEIPLTISKAEMEILKARCDRIARECMELHRVSFTYLCGSMIELPRAALLAGEIAESAEFFSFGTNDLTQTCFGFSRDDAEGKFLPAYIHQHILKDNPFAVLDREGVGRLMRIAVEEGRKTRPDLMIGICGEHGGDPSSVEFCHEIGLDLVSCSPYRIPIARLAAAQAALKHPRPVG